MRIVHHSTMVEHGSGMMRQVADLVRAERRRGLDSGVVDTFEKNKMGVDASGVPLCAFGVEAGSRIIEDRSPAKVSGFIS